MVLSQSKPEHKGCFYPESKVYYDGSHYVAIPHTIRKTKPRRKPVEDVITVPEDDIFVKNKSTIVEDLEDKTKINITKTGDSILEENEKCSDGSKEEKKKVNYVQLTYKQLFDKLYKEYFDNRKSELRDKIIEAMLPYFDSLEETKSYVDLNLQRKRRNLIVRRVRMMRKAYLANFNYFVTFTYDDKKHNEDTFRKQLKNKLSLLSHRKEWKYMGVWERSPELNRLHFHGLFNIPNGTLQGEFVELRDYSTTKHKMQITNANSYFLERFGRNDFKEINTDLGLGKACAYLIKYIEKTGEKIVYSKNLPMFFLTDVSDDDILCDIGTDGQKFLLFDDFGCWDEGCYVGQVSHDTINQMRKCNS